MWHTGRLGTLTAQMHRSGHKYAQLRTIHFITARLGKIRSWKGATKRIPNIYDGFGMKVMLCWTTDDAMASNAEHKKQRYRFGGTPTWLLSQKGSPFCSPLQSVKFMKRQNIDSFVECWAHGMLWRGKSPKKVSR